MKQKRSKHSKQLSQSKILPEIRLSIGNSGSNTYVVIKSKGVMRLYSSDRLCRHRKNVEEYRDLVLPY